MISDYVPARGNVLTGNNNIIAVVSYKNERYRATKKSMIIKKVHNGNNRNVTFEREYSYYS